MRTFVKLFIVLFFPLCIIPCNGQIDDTSPEIKQADEEYYQPIDSLANKEVPLAAIGRHDGDRIILRWAPNRIDRWINGMKYGYRVDRLELDDSLEAVGQWDTIYTGIKKPYSIEKFKEEISKYPDDDYLRAAAEGLYGYQLEHGNKVDRGEAFENIDEFHDRFVICQVAADLSPRAAEGLGWRLEDRKIKPKATYLYRVFVPGKDSSVFDMEALVLVEYDSLAQWRYPLIGKIEEKDGQVDLLFSREYNNKFFTAFDIEKSDDNGKTWKLLNDAPFTQPLTDNPIGNKKYIVYSDTGLINFTPYLYRAKGHTPFGDLSIACPPKKAMARDRTPPQPPDSIKVVMNDQKQMEISWLYLHPPRDLAGFIVARSSKPFEKVVALHKDRLPPETRSFVDKDPMTTHNNFYTLFVIDTSGNINFTRSVFGEYIDEEPPTPPQDITYEIDTTGILRLVWSKGDEPDLMGYHVYFGNAKNHFLVNKTNQVLQDTVFIDTLDLRALNETVYYRITALDLNYNVSEFSEMIEVVKPDLVPPSPPIIISHKGLTDGIEFHIKLSHSRDVASYKLERFSDGKWQVAKSLSSNQMTEKILDDSPSLVKGKLYKYRVVAIDDAGNRSKIAYTYTARTRMNEPVGRFEKFELEKAKNKVVIKWEYTGRNHDIVRIYRYNNQKKPILIKSIDAGKRSAKDFTVRKDLDYTYKLKLLTKGGVVLDRTHDKTIRF